MKNKFLRTFALMGLSMTLGLQAQAQVQVDKNLATYKPQAQVTGIIKSVGSDTMNNMMTLWAEGFRKHQPGVQVEIEGKGSSTAPAALINGSATFGPMSREMKQNEIDEFEKRFGYKPTAIATSIDMLAVYVHKDNPLKGLSMNQVDGIFSKTRKSGFEKDITTWGELGLKGSYEKMAISLYGRNAASGTYGYFKEHALAKGDFKDSVKEQPGSSSVVQGVANDKAAIGYSGIGYKTADVKALAIAKGNDQHFVAADPKNGYSGSYPLSRPLLIYVNFQPGKELDPLRAEFVRYVLSKEGQEAVVKDGYLPITAKAAQATLATLGIKPALLTKK